MLSFIIIVYNEIVYNETVYNENEIEVYLLIYL